MKNDLIKESIWNDKTKIRLLWLAFVISVIGAIIFWFQMDKASLNYDEVKVTVVSSETKKVKNKQTGNTTDFYEVKVLYEGETKDLENVHNAYSYTKGKQVTAYLSNNRLFANIEGVKTSTPMAMIYYVFLFGSFILLFAAAIYTSKVKTTKINQKEEK